MYVIKKSPVIHPLQSNIISILMKVLRTVIIFLPIYTGSPCFAQSAGHKTVQDSSVQQC